LGNTDGYEILTAAFDELNEAYMTANVADGFELKIKEFQTMDELDSYVNEVSYFFADKALCFALGWHQFTPSENSFIFDLRWNYGDIFQTRRPQTEYEESL